MGDNLSEKKHMFVLSLCPHLQSPMSLSKFPGLPSSASQLRKGNEFNRRLKCGFDSHLTLEAISNG